MLNVMRKVILYLVCFMMMASTSLVTLPLGTAAAGVNQTFNYTGSITKWTVPSGAGGIYTITAYGASGGSTTTYQAGTAYGGKGARMQGNFQLNDGDQLLVLVGGKGSDAYYSDGGGGGGTYVVKSPDPNNLYLSTPLVVAGGGGGGAKTGVGFWDGADNGHDATTTNNGTSGGSGSIAGGGFYGDGVYTGGSRYGSSYCGKAFVNGGAGGYGYFSGGIGGFGGGSTSIYDSINYVSLGGNGGGYSGGSTPSGLGAGGGGGSYNAGTNQSNSIRTDTGNGYVTITYVGPAIPPAPTGLTASVTSSSQINLAWNSSSGATSYKVYRNSNLLTTVSSTSCSDIGLTANTTYSYYVVACNSAGDGLASNIVSATTAPPTPNPASNLQITGITTSSISASWSANGNPPGTIYNLVLQNPSNGQWLQNPETTNTSYTFTGLSVNTQYNVWVRVRNSWGVWATSNYQLIGTVYTLPNPASNLQITGIATSSILASWSANGNPSGAIYNLVLQNPSSGQWLQNPETTSTSYTFTGLSANTQYNVWVRVRNADGAWATPNYQLIGTIYTLANATSSPSYGTITQTSMVLNWNTNGNSSSTQYFSAVVPNGANPDVTTNWVANSGWQTNISTWTASGLTAGTQYRAYVKATNGDGTRTSWADFGPKWMLPNMPSNIAGNNGGLAWSNTAGRGWVTLSWPAVTGATGYTVQVFDGNTYRAFDVGNTTSWDSRTAKIYPSETTLDSYINNSQSGDLFNHSAAGLDLRDNPNKLYLKTVGTTYDMATNYWFRVTAYNSSGDSGIDWTQGYFPTLPNRTATTAPGAPTINFTSPSGYTSGSWTNNTSVSFTITNGVDNGGSGIQKSQYSLDNGSTWTDYSSTVTISTVGTTTVLARTLDNAGNISTNTSATIKIEPLGSLTISLTQSPTAATSNPVTITASISGSISGIAVQKWVEGNQNVGYFASGGTTFTGQTFTVNVNDTYTVYAKDNAGNEAVSTITITNIHVYPTLNIPTISGLIYLGEDITVSNTGTNINQAAYRVYYTTNVTAPTITNGNDPGTGWVDSGVAGSMTVTGGTGVSAIVPGASLSGNNWTYITFKVWAASSTNDAVTQYSQSYVVSNDGNSAINYVGHNQIIKILQTNKDVIVSDPETPVQAYNPDPASVGYLDQNNLFENENPYLRYRLEFDVLRPQIVKDIEIDFDFNYYNNYWIEFKPKTMTLEKLNNDGTVAGVLKTYNMDGVSYFEQSTNRYILKLGNDNGGNPIIQVNGQGRYAVEYTGELIVQTDNRGGTVLMRNNAEMFIYTTNSIYPDTLETQRPSRKFHIDTKVIKANVWYQ